MCKRYVRNSPNFNFRALKSTKKAFFTYFSFPLTLAAQKNNGALKLMIVL